MGRRTAFLLVTAAIWVILTAGCASRHEFTGTLYDGERAAGNIAGLEGPDTPFDLTEHRGEFVLVSFGYTSCPDVCPITLSDMAAFTRALEAENAELADRVSVVFVTVDPERDLPERLQSYVTAFHPDFHGVYIGDEAELEAVEQAYGVYAQKNELSADESAMGYLVDHTAGTFVVGPEGNLRLYFSFGTTSDEILADMKALLKSG